MTPKEVVSYSKVMRKCGIRELRVSPDGSATLVMGEIPAKRPHKSAKSAPIDPLTEEPSTDQLLFWSSTPAPEAPREEA